MPSLFFTARRMGEVYEAEKLHLNECVALKCGRSSRRLGVGSKLTTSYDFTVPGNYTIAFPGPLMDVASKKADVPHPFGESHPRGGLVRAHRDDDRRGLRPDGGQRESA